MLKLEVSIIVCLVQVYFELTLFVVTFLLNVLADREVQRILLELLNQMDGFDQAENVKVM